MKRKDGKNYIYNVLYEILALLVPLVTTPYISRVLGAEGIGLYSVTYANASYFVLTAALGSTVYGRRETAYQQQDIEARSLVFWELILLRSALAAVCLGLYLCYVSYIHSMIALIQGIYIVSVVFDVTWFFQGMENFGVVVLRNSCVKLANIAFIFLFVKAPEDVWIYVLGLALLSFAANAVSWLSLPKMLVRPRWKEMRPFRHLKGSFALFIPTIAAQVYLALDKTMLGAFTETDVENGYYEQTQKIIRICWSFVTTFATVMTPRIAQAFARKDMSELREEMRDSYRFMWLISVPIVLGVIGITANLVPWFFGPGFEKVALLLYLFSAVVFAVGLNAVTGSQYLVATKRQRWYTLSIIFGAACNFCLNLLLIPKYYSAGAAVASVIAEWLISALMIVYSIKVLKEFDLSDVFSGSWRYWLAGGIMFAPIWCLSSALRSSAVHTFILIAAGGLVYFAVLLILKDKFALQGVEIIKKTVRKIGKRVGKG